MFDGGMGLAPKWIDRKLNKKGQRWISACLFARVNAFATTEAISLRGNHDALAVSVGETEEFTLEEGAFYGQYFTPLDEPIAWYACVGEDQAAGDSGGLVLRDCAEPDPSDPSHTLCGFNFTGECADFSGPATPDPYACKSFEAPGFYAKCHEQPGTGKWPKTKKYKEVITVVHGELTDGARAPRCAFARGPWIEATARLRFALFRLLKGFAHGYWRGLSSWGDAQC